MSPHRLGAVAGSELLPLPAQSGLVVSYLGREGWSREVTDGSRVSERREVDSSVSATENSATEKRWLGADKLRACSTPYKAREQTTYNVMHYSRRSTIQPSS